jgi:hypothetical protein
MADFSQFTGVAENVEVARQLNPQLQLRSQPEREAVPDPFQKAQERAGHSEWSGASGGGGVWAGRSR